MAEKRYIATLVRGLIHVVVGHASFKKGVPVEVSEDLKEKLEQAKQPITQIVGGKSTKKFVPKFKIVLKGKKADADEADEDDADDADDADTDNDDDADEGTASGKGDAFDDDDDDAAPAKAKGGSKKRKVRAR